MNGNTETCLAANTLLQDGRYRIVRHISSGGFGHTYEGVHTILDARVAIKEFFPKMFCDRDDSTHHVTVSTRTNRDLVDKLLKKFNEEVAAVFKMRHDNIVRVTDIFEENGTAYYVMDYIEGRSLQQIVGERGALPEKEAVGYVRQVADALSYVHSLHRLHLDIKPGNIMVDARGHATLIDFGASKHYDTESGENTSTLMGVNTKGYAPIEQTTQGFTKFSPATDIYALGATLYKLLTGITPPDANMLMAKEEHLQPLPDKISAATRNAIKKAMEPVRAGRPQSIDSFLSLLDAASVAVGDDEETKADVKATRVKEEALDRTLRKSHEDSRRAKGVREKVDGAKRETKSKKEEAEARSLRIIKKVLIISSILGFGSLGLMGILENLVSGNDGYGDKNSQDPGFLYRIQVDGKFGFIDSLGNEIIKPQYKYACNFTKDGLACIISDIELKKDSSLIVKYGYINKRNELVIDTVNQCLIGRHDEIWIPSVVEIANEFHSGTIDFSSDMFDLMAMSDDRFVFKDKDTNLYGYKNSKGDTVIAPIYGIVSAFNNGYAVVHLPWNYNDNLLANLNPSGVIDVNGNIIIPHEYSFIRGFTSKGETWASILSLSSDGDFVKEWVLIDKSGQILTGPITSGVNDQIYNSLDDYFVESIDLGLLGTVYSFRDKNGDYLTDYNHDSFLSLSNDKCEVLSDVTRFSDGYAGIKRYSTIKNIDVWVFANHNLDNVSEPYDSLLPFAEGLAAVKELQMLNNIHGFGKWGFVNKKFELSIPYSFDEVSSFSHGLATFKKNGNSFDIVGYINKAGDVVWQTKRKKKTETY